LVVAAVNAAAHRCYASPVLISPTLTMSAPVPRLDQGGVTTYFSLTPAVLGVYSVYQNIVYECGGGPSGVVRAAYSEAFPVGGGALSEQRDDMFVPRALRRYRFRAKTCTWLEKGPIASSYRRGRVYGSGPNRGADRMAPWGVARGRHEMRVIDFHHA
jgi:hypothetical protein